MLARFDPKQAEVNDLRQYFGNDKFSIIGNAVDIQLDKQKYPLSDDKFIVFYYRVDNNPISKRSAIRIKPSCWRKIAGYQQCRVYYGQ